MRQCARSLVIGAIPVVSCDQPHAAEVIIQFPVGPWPSRDESARRADARCTEELTPALINSPLLAELRSFIYFPANAMQWRGGQLPGHAGGWSGSRSRDSPVGAVPQRWYGPVGKGRAVVDASGSGAVSGRGQAGVSRVCVRGGGGRWCCRACPALGAALALEACGDRGDGVSRCRAG